MSQLFGFVENGLINFFIKESEESCDFCNDFLQITPDLLCNGELNGFFGHLPEESADGFIIAEASGYRKYVISDGTDCSVRNLGGKVGTLAFAKTQILLAVLYDHLQTPSSGIEFPCPEEIKRDVGGEQTVPLAIPASLYKENPDRYAVKSCVSDDIIRPELAAVFDLFLLLGLPGKGGYAYFTVFSLEAGLSLTFVRLADLYHPEPMALDVTGFYKPYNICAGKPAVSQHIFEPELVFDCPADHLFGKLNLGHPVFTLSFLVHIRVAFKTPASLDFLVAETIPAFLSGFSNKGEVKQKLRPAVGERHQKTFEAKYASMFQMRIDPADILHCLPGLVKVRVIYYKTTLLTLGVSPHPYLVPQLGGYALQSLSPCHGRIGDKAVKHIFLSIHENLYRRIFAVENIFYTKV